MESRPAAITLVFDPHWGSGELNRIGRFVNMDRMESIFIVKNTTLNFLFAYWIYDCILAELLKRNPELVAAKARQLLADN